MRRESAEFDVVVTGGGLAGVAAAIAAARLGASVALVHNRPVLGGNSSSEVRVWVCGATAAGAQRYARETGIVGELYLENQYRNPEGNPVFWDMVVLDAVRAEPGIALYLNTDVREVEAEGPEDARVIRSVTGWTMASERETRFVAPLFLDCTGDGLVGHLAGARYRVGREARAEHGESWAPEEADELLLGSTILFYTKDLGHPVRYVPPDIAADITATGIPERRVIKAGANGAAYWWIEWGGELDTVHDNERIRDELWSVIYGIWDYIKNSGRFPDAANLTLEWVGSVPGKREYRRFVGDHVLTQSDIVGQRAFDDRIGYGGWSIDLHPPGGMYAAEGGAAQYYPDGVYHVPFRSLYSANTANLLFAGRDISATHIAFGSTRVMATCAVMGEAAGTAAALCARGGTVPRALASSGIAALQRTLLRQDAAVIGLRYDDPADLAQRAEVGASSTLTALAVEPGADGPDGPDGPATSPWPLAHDAGLLLPADPGIDGVRLLADVAPDGAGTELAVELWDTGRPENAVPHTLRAAVRVPLEQGGRQWLRAPLRWAPAEPGNAFLVVRAHPGVALHVAAAMRTGVLSLTRAGAVDDGDVDTGQVYQPVVDWQTKPLRRRSFCFRSDAPTGAFAAERAVGGYARPFGGPQMWVSDGLAAPQHLRLDWREPVAVGRVELVFDDDVNEYMNNLHYHRSPFAVMPELVRDYTVEARTGAGWTPLVAENGNRRRHRVHVLPEAVRADALRLTVAAAEAHVVALRVYGPDTPP
ncbi:FAD dependent oxidoreductase [Murinocardiopsis flavida]|uniref:FAD dependent oxidoreductase n=1 Tax=Murinocardiopsis flavida TaxID=645275 RepID=A0A2P8CSW5_9ACTN|nr:FAD-dependent oxidoreductase [Murinocardiopsis flavida]PSK88061.1 FAD dependent oxidoreductase [Murinocardiopsis flavida]